MKIYVMNYLEAREFDPEELTLAVRIFDPGAWKVDHNMPVPLKCSTLWVDEIRQEFEDYDLAGYEREAPGQFIMLRRERKCFELPMAEFLLSEVARTIHKAEALMVHCNAGLNRSPAVALALVERFGLAAEWCGRRKKIMGDAAREGRHPNEWIRRLFMEAKVEGVPGGKDHD